MSVLVGKKLRIKTNSAWLKLKLRPSLSIFNSSGRERYNLVQHFVIPKKNQEAELCAALARSAESFFSLPPQAFYPQLFFFRKCLMTSWFSSRRIQLSYNFYRGLYFKHHIVDLDLHNCISTSIIITTSRASKLKLS